MKRLYIPIGLLLLRAGDAAATAGSPQIPFAFVENRGQSAPEIRFIGNGPDFKAWFEDRGVVLQQGEAVTRMRFAGGKPSPEIDAVDPTGARVNYLRGRDPERWKTDLPLFGAIRYRGVWPGIEIWFKAEGSRTKAEYVVSPGASVSQIRLRFDGDAEIRGDGSLMISGKTGVFQEDRPVLFQDSAAGRVPVGGNFQKLADGTIGFSVGEYDAAKPLVVDPPIVFSGYFGGSSQTTITAVAVNANYNVVVAGWTLGTDLPSAGGARTKNSGGVDVFVANFSPAGGALVYCTYLGGSGDDRAFGVAVDAALNTYVTGWTSSANFPVAGGVQSKLGGPRDAFVTKLNPTLSAIVYSTYLGGSGTDWANGIVVDSTMSAYIVGDTTSTNMPLTPGAYQQHLAGGQDAFIAKLNAAGNALTYSTYYGGGGTDHGAAIQVDATGAAYFGGSTYSPNLPAVSAYQPHSGGGQDGFFAKLSPGGTALVFSTYFGGSGGSPGAPEEINSVAMGPAGNPTVAGTTSSPDFPQMGVNFQTGFGGGQTDGFIARFSSSNGALVRSTLMGGSLNDGINSVAVDYRGDIYVAGYTTSTDFPVQRPVQLANSGGMDAFAAKVTFASIEFGTYLGGMGNDSANAIALDGMTSMVVVGTTGSGNFPVVANAAPWSGSILSSFITKLAPDFNEAIVASPVFSMDPWHTTGYNGANSIVSQSTFGLSTDLPVIGDWDGSGVKRIGVFRNGAWLLDTNGNGVLDAGDKTVLFGQAGDVPVVGDWTGTGTLKLGLYRAGSFILDLSGHLSGVPTGLSDANFPFGLASDIPIVGDWSNSGTSKVGVFRNGLWLVDYNGDRVFNGLDKSYTFGQAGDIPLTGHWDSAGLVRLGLYRNGVWILDYHGEAQSSGSSAFTLNFTFGSVAYKPLTW